MFGHEASMRGSAEESSLVRSLKGSCFVLSLFVTIECLIRFLQQVFDEFDFSDNSLHLQYKKPKLVPVVTKVFYIPGNNYKKGSVEGGLSLVS